MVASLERKIQYIFQLSTNVADATSRAADSLDRTQAKVDSLETSSRTLGSSMGTVTAQAQRAETALDSASASAQGFGTAMGTITSGASRAQEGSESAEDAVVSLRREMAQTSSQTASYTRSVEQVRATSQEAVTSVQTSMASVEQTQISMLTQMTTILSLREGVSAITSGMIGLGLATGETAEALNKVNAAFSLMSGAVSVIKSVQAVMSLLNITTASFAAITTYLSVLKNPVFLGIAAAGLGVMGGTYLALSGQSSSSSDINSGGGNTATASTTSYNNVFNISGSGANAIATEISALSTITGGALR